MSVPPRRLVEDHPLPPPVFVLGAPRSGTTYLVEVLNRHPQIFLTNETRVMAFFNRALNDLARDEWAIRGHREQFVEHLRAETAGIVGRFYRRLGAPDGARWGDKHPHYADPVLEPGCLELIDETFPDAQYLHILRDGRDVAASIVNRGWTDLDLATDVWRRCVTTAREFGLARGLDRYHELRYEDLVASGVQVIGRALDFLGLAEAPPVTSFLVEQEHERTPFSGPVTARQAIGHSGWRERLTEEQALAVNDALADVLVECGYESYAWRRARPVH